MSDDLITTADVKMVTITETEYNRLTRVDRMMNALEAGGVDNWEWYGDSLADFWEEEEEAD